MAEFQYLNQGNSEIQDKQAEAYLYESSGVTGIAASGVIEGLVVRQTATASGSVLIDAGAALNQASLGQGADRLINPSQKTLDIFTANPVGGLPRNDVIEFDSITTLISVRLGTPNATPSDPTVPATSVALARLRHAASATTIPTAKIDQLQVPTYLRGVSPSAPFAQAAGSVTVTGIGGDTAIADITFPAGRFSVPPLVICGGVARTTQAYVAEATLISTAGATVRLYVVAGASTFSGNYAVSWSAVQMTPTTAAG